MLSQQIEIPCPYCQHRLKQPLSRLRKDARISCPSCRRQVIIGGAGFEDLQAPAKRINGAAKKLAARKR
jgi:DNA-directed RNA polymerase subunit RPC12/RpoP